MKAARIDGWRVGGWAFLTLLLLFAVLPMAWMLLTSVKTQFAAAQYPPECGRTIQPYRTTRASCHPPAMSARSS